MYLRKVALDRNLTSDEKQHNPAKRQRDGSKRRGFTPFLPRCV